MRHALRVSIDVETRAEKVDSGWKDHDGFIGPFRPGVGPRTDPSEPFELTVPVTAMLRPELDDARSAAHFRRMTERRTHA